MKLYSKYIETKFSSKYHLARLTAGFFVSICLLPLFSCSEMKMAVENLKNLPFQWKPEVCRQVVGLLHNTKILYLEPV